MKKISSLTLGLAAAIFVAGCGKDADSVEISGPLNGTYQFVSVYLQAKTEMSQKVGGETVKTVSEVEYTSSDNTGMVLIEGTNISSSGFGYKIHTVVTGQTFINDVADGPAMTMDFEYTMPKSNSSGSFRYAGTDSLVIEKGFMEIPSTGQQMAVVPNATKYSVVNGDLIFMSKINMSGTVTQGGMTVTQKQTGITITRLRKL